jgi:hypothetical protein
MSICGRGLGGKGLVFLTLCSPNYCHESQWSGPNEFSSKSLNFKFKMQSLQSSSLEKQPI